MSKIKILPENLANKIAAGEVVQRPESVVKELLENSIDANASEITLLIKRAGKVLIQVVDNGEGMSEDDAKLCILKHATSKIITDLDLEAINTLGFRGEALSSITAVSQVELRSQTIDSEVGVQLRIDDGQNIEQEYGSFAKGTTVSVKNLFFNTPARRSFLRTDGTETKHIIETFNRLALSHPNIAFRLFIDDDVTLDFPSGNISERVGDVFGEGILSALITVEERTEYLSIFGFIGKPSLLKKSKGDQYLFINNRYVFSKQINHAVFTAYENVLEKGDYPFFVLFMEIDPHRIDINVHPSKLEVRFDDEKDIYSFVVSVLRKSLSSYDLVPNLVFSQSTNENERMSITPFQRTEISNFSDRPSNPKYDNKSQSFNDKDIDMLFGSLSLNVNRESSQSNISTPFENDNNIEESVQKNIPIRASSEEKENSSFIIQLHHKYILSQIKSGLMIIDQHAAHERILYEKALKLFDMNMPFAQPLLFPKTIEVDASKLIMLKELQPYFQKLGFEIKFFGQNTIIVEAVPQDIHPGNEEEILLEIMDEYLINRREKKILEVKDNMAKSFSCKSAIKTGDKLSELEMRVLIDQLFATTMPYVCPHGRPIVVKISLDEFDRRFGRT
jgi:DNA mismatch repair protein MutL